VAAGKGYQVYLMGKMDSDLPIFDKKDINRVIYMHEYPYCRDGT
jgi:hypothetical protein